MRLSRSLAGVLAAVLGLLPVAPPEHVHEAEEQGHLHVIVHRHPEAHGILERHSGHDAASASWEDDDHDGPAFTLSDTYTVPASPVVAGPPPVAGVPVDPAAPPRVERALVGADVLIHGPPRAPTALRAPPVSPAS